MVQNHKIETKNNNIILKTKYILSTYLCIEDKNNDIF